MTQNSINLKEMQETKEFLNNARQEAENFFNKEESKKIIEDVDKLNQKFMECQLTTPDHIYIDLALLKDLYIGALFAMILNADDAQEKYAYIKSQLKDYQVRVFDDPIRYFPKLNITREEFITFFNDVNNHDQIYKLAPFTIMHYVLKANMKTNATYSQMKKKYQYIPNPGGGFIKDYKDVVLYINTYPLQLSKHHTLNLQRVIGDNLGASVIVFTEDIRELPLSFVKKIEEYDIFRLDKFLDNPLVNKLMSDKEFTAKYVYAPLLIDPSKEEQYKEEENRKNDKDIVGHDKDYIYHTLQLCCLFKWLEAARYSITLDTYGDGTEEIDYDTPLPNLT